MNKYYLFALIISGALYLLLFEDDEVVGPQLSLDQSPDYYIETLQFKQYDTTGKLQYQFKATRANHSKNQQTTRYENPELQLQQSGQPWQIQASYAVQDHQSNWVNLGPDVVVAGILEQQKLPITFKTQSLDVNLASLQLQSHALIQFESAKFSGTAGAVSANLKSKLFKLYDHVHQEYHEGSINE